MKKRILLRIKNRFIKGIILRRLVEAHYEVIDATDYDDLRLKMDVYAGDFMLYLLEITDDNASDIFGETHEMKKEGPLRFIPILALVPRVSSDIVSNALKAGMEDVFLLARGKDFDKDQLMKKLDQVLEKLNPSKPAVKAEDLPEEMAIDEVMNHLEMELRHAGRGKYPVSMLMVRFTHVDDDKCIRFIDRLRGILRESDRVYRLNRETWLITCPFTDKSFVIEIERKVFSTFEAEIGAESRHRKINLFTAVYPQDGDNLEHLLKRLETGISNSLEINNIKAPLNSLSAKELEAYKNKIRQYKRFF